MIKRIAFILIPLLLVVSGIRLFSFSTATSADSGTQSPIAPAQSTPTPDTMAEDAQAIAEIKKRLAGHEDEPAEAFFKNIEILKGKKASRLPAMMSALTGLLGVGCSYCHITNEWDREDKPTKQTARKMFRMIGTINKDNFEGKNAVSCWTCHRGNPHPPIQSTPTK